MLSFLAIWTLLSATTGAGDWSQFRGPDGNGVAPATANPPIQWSESKNIQWKTAVTGCGRSSPIILGDRIWLTTADPKEVKRTRIGPDDMQVAQHVSFHVLCLDRTDGKRLWQVTVFNLERPAPVHWLNSWATPTPVLEAGRLYCDFGTYGTVCVDAETGKILWKQHLPLDHQVGPGSSPVLFQDLLILVRDGRDAQYVAAIRKDTGQPVWKTDRPPLTARDNAAKKSFSTPLVIHHNGRTQMIVPGAQWVVAYDPASGKEVWRVRHGNGFSVAPRPVAGHAMAYICTGAMVPQLWAIRLDGQGDVTDTHVAWKAKSGVSLMSSPVLVGDEIYCGSDAGIASCFDARTGKLLWRERLGSGCLASPIAAAGRLYFFSRDAKTTVLKAGKEFSRLEENSLDGFMVATPAVVDRSLFLRTDTHLYRIEDR